MPAAAVIPAPIRNIKVVAVKKLVVEFLGSFLLALTSRKGRSIVSGSHLLVEPSFSKGRGGINQSFTVNKLGCSKQAFGCEHISME